MMLLPIIFLAHIYSVYPIGTPERKQDDSRLLITTSEGSKAASWLLDESDYKDHSQSFNLHLSRMKQINDVSDATNEVISPRRKNPAQGKTRTQISQFIKQTGRIKKQTSEEKREFRKLAYRLKKARDPMYFNLKNKKYRKPGYQSNESLFQRNFRKHKMDGLCDKDAIEAAEEYMYSRQQGIKERRRGNKNQHKKDNP